MIRRLLAQRSVRKLLRNRPAVAALLVIGVYALFSVALMFGLITKEATFEQVGVRQQRGFWKASAPEKRLADAEFRLDQVESALGKRDPERIAQALSDLPFAELRVADVGHDVLGQRVEAAWEIYDELAELESLDTQPEVLPRLVELEQAVAGLFVEPVGLDGWLYDLRLSLGTDRQGRSILWRALYSIKVAILIGVVSAFVSVLIGTLLGGAAAFFGGWVDHVVVWLYSTFSSVPYIILLMVLAAMFVGGPFDGTLVPVYAAFCMSFWIGPCRVVRGEVLKIKELEYVQAATAVGFGRMHILLRHVIPNTVHLMFINFSLLFISAIKAEVILSFLGLGVKNEPSWGVMINQARQEVLNGFFWQIGAATVLMVVLVLAFNTLSDALQDAFDPKHVG